jgi:hypothetical protein
MIIILLRPRGSGGRGGGGNRGGRGGSRINSTSGAGQVVNLNTESGPNTTQV